MEWAKFKGGQDLDIEMKPEHYPFWTRGTGAKTARGASFVNSLQNVSLLASIASAPQASRINVTTTTGTYNPPWEATLVRQRSMADLFMGTFKKAATATTAATELKPIGKWSLHFDNSAIDDLWIAVNWSAGASP